MRPKGHMGSNPMPSAYGSMVKRTSCLASNEMFQVQILVELLNRNGRATRLATGPGWKPGELYGLEGSTPSLSAEAIWCPWCTWSAHLPVKQKVWVQLPSVTPCCRRGSTEKGVRLVSGIMLVRIQSSALTSRWCNGQHKTLLRSWSWFDSRSGY